MSGLTIPLILAILGLILGIVAFRGIRRGSGRFYALEREALLRRASFTLLGSLLLLTGSIALLIYDQQQTVAEILAAEETAATEAASQVLQIESATSTPIVIESAPPTAEPAPTEDLDRPTLTPTPFIRRGIIENTGGSGANLRDGPGTNYEDSLILQDGEIVTLVETEDPVDANGYIWIKVRTIAQQEGWVVDIFLTIQER